MVDLQRYIDRMLGTENLTDYLEDEDANFLLNWGIARLPALIGEEEDSQVADDRITYLMGFIRALNQLTGNLAGLQETDLTDLAGRAQQAFGAEAAFVPEELPQVLSSLAEMTPRQAIEYLISFVLPAGSGPAPQGQ